ncbi:MAG: hypothetical protein AMXMBFR33_49000 [Candidatus Xenobia bacterium]
MRTPLLSSNSSLTGRSRPALESSLERPDRVELGGHSLQPMPGLRALLQAAGIGASRGPCPLEVRATRVLAATLEMPADQLLPGADLFQDLGGDSIDWFEFITALESEFSVQIAENDAAAIRSVQDAVGYLNRRSR